ncbi:MAG TPA: hypothetical protein VKV25_06925, partial [Acidimicrobiales bacterium]|nr:hypothetical protein [Acidimicrobiales bacterium]
MPGMGGSTAGDPAVVAAFHAALRSQTVVVVVFAVVAVLARAWMAADPRAREEPAEHPARRLLRLAFGLLWLVD